MLAGPRAFSQLAASFFAERTWPPLSPLSSFSPCGFFLSNHSLLSSGTYRSIPPAAAHGNSRSLSCGHLGLYFFFNLVSLSVLSMNFFL